MSDLSGTKRALSNIADQERGRLKRRWLVYGVIAIVAVLVLAYIDAGEEPLRPIVHRIASPVSGGGQ